MKILAYSISKSLQTFLPCYFGNKVFLASEKISTSLFHSKWIDEDKQFKSSVKIFLENLKKPIIISALNGFIAIDYDTLTTICNCAYSLYALFKKVNA